MSSHHWTEYCFKQISTLKKSTAYPGIQRPWLVKRQQRGWEHRQQGLLLADIFPVVLCIPGRCGMGCGKCGIFWQILGSWHQIWRKKSWESPPFHEFPGGYGQIWSYLWQSLRSTMTRFNFEVLMVAANGQHDDQEKHLASSAPRMKRQSHGGMNQEKRIGCVSDSDIQGNKLAQSME